MFSFQLGIVDIRQYPQHIRKKFNFSKVQKETNLCWTIAVAGLVLSNRQDHLKANGFKCFLRSVSAVFKGRILPKFKTIKFFQAL